MKFLFRTGYFCNIAAFLKSELHLSFG